MENICYMIDAYDKDAKSMNGITNKILRWWKNQVLKHLLKQLK
jgi:hypothetical protein